MTALSPCSRVAPRVCAMRLAAIVPTAACLVGLTRPASACDFAGAAPLVVDAGEQRVDHAPPAKVASVGVTISRGRGPGGSCGKRSSTSCDDLGAIVLYPTAPADDRSGPDDLGYVVRLVSGELPEGASLPVEAVVPSRGSGIVLSWIDGDTDDQEPVRFAVTVAAVDRAGNVGPASDPVPVVDEGGGSGCQTGGRAKPGVWAALGVLAVAGGLARRRRS